MACRKGWNATYLMNRQRIVYPLSRRKFILASGGMAGVIFAAGPAVVRGQNLNSKLNIAGIGVGGKGASDVDGMGGENIVALCDVDTRQIDRAKMKYPNARVWRDYREMLEKQKDIDAVTVSTPDHSHAPAAMMAIKLGKHAYVQKPMTHSIFEARKLTEAARERKVATLMGNQGHSGEGVRKLCSLIWSGALGDITEVHCWTDRPIWPQGLTRPEGSKPVPAYLDWDLFLGPAPERPYNDGYHTFAWRGWWDFGTGALGDMACHIMDPACWALKLRDPISVEAVQEGNTAESGPKSSTITYHFPARNGMPPVKVVWHDGRKTPSRELLGLAPDAKIPDNGSLFIGTKGKITTETYGGNPRLTPDSALKELPKVELAIPLSPGHYQEFILACKGQKTPGMGDFDYAGPFTEFVLLGTVAVRAGKKLLWDGPNMKVTNAPEANQYVRREYRKGWTL